MEYLGCILPSNLGGSLSYTGDFNSPVVYSQIIISAARYGVFFFSRGFWAFKAIHNHNHIFLGRSTTVQKVDCTNSCTYSYMHNIGYSGMDNNQISWIVSESSHPSLRHRHFISSDLFTFYLALIIHKFLSYCYFYLWLYVNFCSTLNKDFDNFFLTSQRCDVKGGVSFLKKSKMKSIVKIAISQLTWILL